MTERARTVDDRPISEAPAPGRLRAAIKSRDTWFPTIFHGPLANRLVGLIGRYDRILPNHVTVLAMIVACGAALGFAGGSYGSIVTGALLIQVSLVLDCADGQLARYRGLTSPFGGALDRVFDRAKMLLYVAGLAWGASSRSGDGGVWAAAFLTGSGHLLVGFHREQFELLKRAGGIADRAQERTKIPSVLRGLDLPFVRPWNADHYFLIAAFCILDQVPALLAVLALLATSQALLRPVYFVFVLRRDYGRWPWEIRGS